MDVSVVIVNWNTKRLLLRCLESLCKVSSCVSTEIIVVDNGSEDGSAMAVREWFPETTLIENQENLGFAKANNKGIAAATGRYVCLVNSDVEVLDGCLEALCKYMDENPSIGIAGPKILWPDGFLQDSCRKFPGLWNNFCETFYLNRLLPHSSFFSGEHMMYMPHDRICKVDFLAGCFMMVRRSAFEEVGLLDEQFFIYAEEVDWCKRFRDARWDVVFFPHAAAIHVGRASSRNDPLRFNIESQKARLQYWRKHHTFLGVTGYRLICLLYYMSKMMWMGVVYLLRPSLRQELVSGIRNSCACVQHVLCS
jgi:GT2 family glycosyltransferase